MTAWSQRGQSRAAVGGGRQLPAAWPGRPGNAVRRGSSGFAAGRADRVRTSRPRPDRLPHDRHPRQCGREGTDPDPLHTICCAPTRLAAGWQPGSQRQWAGDPGPGRSPGRLPLRPAGCRPTWKRAYGHHQLMGFVDHGLGGTGEPSRRSFAPGTRIRIRPPTTSGPPAPPSAGPPTKYRRGRQTLIRCDSAGGPASPWPGSPGAGAGCPLSAW